MTKPQDLGPTSVREALLLQALSDAGDILSRLESMNTSVNQTGDKVAGLVSGLTGVLQNASAEYQRAAQLLGAEAKNEVAAYIKLQAEKTSSEQNQTIKALARECVKGEIEKVMQSNSKDLRKILVLSVIGAGLSLLALAGMFAVFLSR